MIHIEAEGCILPAFVVGYQIAPAELAPGGTQPEPCGEFSSWLVTLEQQAGGYAVRQSVVVGAVLRLEANQDKGKQGLSHLIAGLRYMAEDPQTKILKTDYPVLAGLVYSSGEPYGESQLADLEELLGAYIKHPAIETGIEAFIQCAPCDPLQYFADWNVFTCKQARSNVDECGAEPQQSNYFDDSNLNLLSLSDDDKFSQEIIDELIRYASTLGLNGEHAKPVVFLLWENSD